MNFAILLNVLCLTKTTYSLSSHTYDYIVIGAGTAGSAVASELSKQTNNTILLIEEGGWSSEWRNLIDNASNYWFVLDNEQIERGYMSVPQINVNNRRIPLYRAKVTGGCGAHYGMCWTLGNKKDFNERWNVDNWRWNDLSKHWDYIQQTIVTNSIKTDGFTKIFLNAAKEHGYNFNPDYNNLNKNGQFGASLFQYAAKVMFDSNGIKYALRQNSWEQYIEPIISQQSNLNVIVYNRVNKILFDTNNIKPKAIGVETTNIKTNNIHKYYASKEVILSAGSFDSPKILLLSGIGDCNEYKLSPCVANIPAVGKGLQEHIYVMLESPPLNDTHPLIKNTLLPPFIFGSDFRIILFDENSKFEFMFVVDSKQKMDLQYIRNNNLNCCFDFNTKYKAETIQLFVLPLHLKSRGYVKLKDNNPESKPVININFLNNEYDKKLLIEAIKKGRQLLYSKDLINLYDNINNEILPGSNINSDEEIFEWSKNVLLSDYHPVSTCKMGMNLDDNSIVVDNRLRVKGIDNLRVVDSSIMPQLISGHTYAVTTLIGIKAAELIVKDNKNYNDNVDKIEL